MTKINRYKDVEDKIVAAIKRGQRENLKTNGIVWDAMVEVSGRDDNPYVWNAIHTRMQKLKDRGIITHDRTTGWTIVEQQKEPA